MASGRLIIASNRLPVTAEVRDGRLNLKPSSGGLATGLGPWHVGSEGLWIGWPGAIPDNDPGHREALDRELAARRIVPIHFPAASMQRHHLGFANRVLWPLHHYLIDRVPVDATGWEAYRQANELFAEAVALHYRSGDTIWVHDYQLMLVPAMVRARLPQARIGFFLHIPFPSSEVFRILPWRREILHGLLGADLLGFHTFSYLRHFVTSLLHVEGVETQVDRVRVDERDVHLGVFPMGIDSARFAALAGDPEVVDCRQGHPAGSGRPPHPARRRPARLHQGHPAPPASRRVAARNATRACATNCATSRWRCRRAAKWTPISASRRQVEETVGRINGKLGTLRSTPVHYMYQSVSQRKLVALYRAADVMLVTPLRDGMNLVAKEYVASRVDDDGVLVLSEFAGAVAELDGAITVNPYDVEGVASAIRRGPGDAGRRAPGAHVPNAGACGRRRCASLGPRLHRTAGGGAPAGGHA